MLRPNLIFYGLSLYYSTTLTTLSTFSYIVLVGGGSERNWVNFYVLKETSKELIVLVHQSSTSAKQKTDVAKITFIDNEGGERGYI